MIHQVPDATLRQLPVMVISHLRQAVSKTVTQWQQRQLGLLPDAAANVAQMAQLARSRLEEMCLEDTGSAGFQIHVMCSKQY